VCAGHESTVAVIVDKFEQVWPSFRQIIPEIPKYINPVAPPQRVELIFGAWSQLVAKIDTLQQEVSYIQIEGKGAT
jgi:hypothetical protein